jgi:hypothetical protein
MESPLASSVYHLVKTLRRQEAIKPSKKIIADHSTGNKRRQYLLPSLAKFQYALQCLRAASMKHIQRRISRDVRIYQPVGRIRPSPQKLDPGSGGRHGRVLGPGGAWRSPCNFSLSSVSPARREMPTLQGSRRTVSVSLPPSDMHWSIWVGTAGRKQGG